MWGPYWIEGCSMFETEVNICKGHIFNEPIKRIKFTELSKTYQFSGDEIGSPKMWSTIAEELKNAYKEYQHERAQEFINQCISFNDFLKAYMNNPIKAQRTYPVGKTMYFGVELEKITESYSSSSYWLDPDAYFITNINMRTTDEDFTNLDYPCYVYIQTDYVKCRQGWDGQWYFTFDNTILVVH